MKKRTCMLAAFVLSIAFLLIACGNSEQIICGNCSSTNPKDSQFCTNCGTAFFQNSTEATTKPMENTAPTSGDQEQSTEPTQAPTEPTKPQPTQPQPTTPSHTHSYSAATCTFPKTCSCGATSGSALGHSWNNATCTSPKKCSRCGTSTGSVTSHNYTKNTTPATCSSQGYTTYTCSSCGDSYKDNYVTASHNYQNYKCTSCSTVDKAHAYEYLVAWVKEYGTRTDKYSTVSYSVSTNVNYVMYYSHNDDMLQISQFYYPDNQTTCSTTIVLDFFTYKSVVGDRSVLGVLDASTFNKNSSIWYGEYNGPDSVKPYMVEYARMSCCDLLDWLEMYLSLCNVGVTVADLGFTSW